MQTGTETTLLRNPELHKPWYALYTRHQHEKRVAEVLTGKGFEVFLPLYQAAHRWKDRNKILSLPLFPSYVFIRASLASSLSIVTTPGFCAFVMAGGRAAPIPDVEIDNVRRSLESSVRLEPHPFLKCGDRVRVKSGSLEGLEGILVRKKNLLRLVISIELLMKAAAVEVDAWQVERIEGSKTPVALSRVARPAFVMAN